MLNIEIVIGMRVKMSDGIKDFCGTVVKVAPENLQIGDPKAEAGLTFVVKPDEGVYFSPRTMKRIAEDSGLLEIAGMLDPAN